MTDHQQAAIEAVDDALRADQCLCESITLFEYVPHWLYIIWSGIYTDMVRYRGRVGAAPGEDEGAVQEFLVFVHTSMDVVRIECTALHTPGEWPKIAEFRVESRNDDGRTEIEHWSVQKARM